MRISSWLAIAITVVTTSCSVGAPPGFSEGTRWTLPLVDPLDDGLLVTPVYFKGQGPFLFAIDPDANVTVIDERVAIAAHLMIDRGYSTRLWGEDGERRIRFNAELRDLQVGNLYVEVRRAVVVPHETLSASGRPIMGVLGRNVIADSLVFGFDRDRGVAWLQVASTFTPPAGATRIDYNPTSTYTPMASPLPLDNLDEPDEPNTPVYTAYDGRAGITDNKAELPFVHAKIDGRDATLSVQLGSAITRLRSALGEPTKTAIEYDATGARRTLGIAGDVRAELGGAVNEHVAVARYVDRTELPSNARFFDGTLGLDFFAPFDVVADWPHHAYYVAPRDRSPQLALRVGRWPELARCAHAGCVTVSVIVPSAPAPAAPGSDVAPPDVPVAHTRVLHVTRDLEAATPLEVRLHARTGDAPDLVVELPAGVRDVLAPLHGDTQYDVIDASPFAATCPNDGGCVITGR
ncbi:MAG TPA: aspartyl protease family protein [Kofleriaceae bacterium]